MAALLVALTVALMVIGAESVFPCNVTFAGVTYNLAPLIARNGSYTFVSKTYDVTGNNLFSGTPDEQESFTYELQICGPVKSSSPKCKPDSAINRIDAQGNCTFFGSGAVAQFSPNPYQDGVYLSYFGGDDLSHVQKYSSRIYFVCDADHEILPPVFEHEKIWYQNHFSIGTKYACPA